MSTKKKKYLKIGIADLLIGLGLIAYSQLSNSASADAITHQNAVIGTMVYVFGAGIVFIGIAVFTFAFVATGRIK